MLFYAGILSFLINQHVVQFSEPIKSQHAQSQVNVGMSFQSGLKTTTVRCFHRLSNASKAFLFYCRDRFRDGYESLRKAFETVDTNRDGYISRNELQKVLFEFHYFLDDVQLNILLDRSVSKTQRNNQVMFFGINRFSRNRTRFQQFSVETPYIAVNAFSTVSLGLKPVEKVDQPNQPKTVFPQQNTLNKNQPTRSG